MRIILGTVIFGAIALPWYVLVLLQNGRAYWNSFFGYHNLERFTSVVNGHSAPWYFYFLVVSLGFAPWSVYLPVAIARTRFWQRNFWSEQPRHAQLGLFAFFWFAGIFIFFSIAVTKLPSYVLPLIPAAAILVALFWSEEFNIDPSPKKSGFWLSRIANVILLFSLAAAFILVPSFLGSDPAVANLPELVANSGLPRRGGIIWAIAGVVAILSFKRTKGWYWLSLSNFLGFLACSILVIFPAASLLDEVRQLPLRQISQTVMEVSKPEEELWMIGFGKPSLVFYTRRPVKFFKNPAAVREYLKNSLDSATESSSCLIVSYLEDIEQIPLPPTRYESIDRRGTYELIRAKLPVFPSN